MIHERWMASGEFSVELSGAAPDTLHRLHEFGHLIVLDDWVEPSLFTTSDLLQMARYTGVVMVSEPGEEGGWRLNGAGLLTQLGDQRNIGPVIQTQRSFDTDTFANVIDRSGSTPYGVLRRDDGSYGPLRAGSVDPISETYTEDHVYQSQRTALEHVCELYSGYYPDDNVQFRTNHDGTIDVGRRSFLFSGYDEVVMVRRTSGTDPVRPVITGPMKAEVSREETGSDVLLMAEGYGYGNIGVATASATSWPYTDLYGVALPRTVMVDEPDTREDNAAARANAWRDRLEIETTDITLETSGFDVWGSLNIGQDVYVYDPDRNLVDTANERWVNGEAVYPKRFICRAIRWPVKGSMGVYFRRYDGTVIDLSRFVVPEQERTVAVEVSGVSRDWRSLTDLYGRVLMGRVQPAPDPSETDQSIPGTVSFANTPWSYAVYVDQNGLNRFRVLVEWATPTNADGSAITDGSHYEVRWQRSSWTGTEYRYVTQAWGLNSYLFDLPLLGSGETVSFWVRAHDLFGHSSAAWSTVEALDADVYRDIDPPPQPSEPTLNVVPLTCYLTHDLTSEAGPKLPLDTRYLAVYASTSAGFTPTAGDQVALIPVSIAQDYASGSFDTEAWSDQTVYVRVTAVDNAGNETAYADASNPVSFTARYIESSDLADEAITAAKLAPSLTTIQVIDDWDEVPTPSDGDVVYLTTTDDYGGDTKQGKRLYYWDSTAADWVLRVRGEDIEANSITAGQIEAGAIGADEIAAHSIFTDKLVVASFDNLFHDPKLRRTWELRGASTGDSGGYAIPETIWHVNHGGASPATDGWAVKDDLTHLSNDGLTVVYDGGGQVTDAFLLDFLDSAGDPDLDVTVAAQEGDRFLVHFDYSNGNGVLGGSIQAFVRYTQEDGTNVDHSSTAMETTNLEWRTMTFRAPAAPANAVSVAFGVRVVQSAGVAVHYFRNFSCRRMATGDLIVDGTITAEHIDVFKMEVGQYIESTVYTPGSAGFRIEAGGDAYFLSLKTTLVRGTITMEANGLLRTLSSGRRIEFGNATEEKILFYSGDGTEASPAVVSTRKEYYSGPTLMLQAPVSTGGLSYPAAVEISADGHIRLIAGRAFGDSYPTLEVYRSGTTGGSGYIRLVSPYSTNPQSLTVATTGVTIGGVGPAVPTLIMGGSYFDEQWGMRAGGTGGAHGTHPMISLGSFVAGGSSGGGDYGTGKFWASSGYPAGHGFKEGWNDVLARNPSTGDLEMYRNGVVGTYWKVGYVEMAVVLRLSQMAGDNNYYSVRWEGAGAGSNTGAIHYYTSSIKTKDPDSIFGLEAAWPEDGIDRMRPVGFTRLNGMKEWGFIVEELNDISPALSVGPRDEPLDAPSEWSMHAVTVLELQRLRSRVASLEAALKGAG
jgi:hypothetical protein